MISIFKDVGNDDDADLWRAWVFLQEWFIRPDGNATTLLIWFGLWQTWNMSNLSLILRLNCTLKWALEDIKYVKPVLWINLPSFLHGTHLASFLSPVSWMTATPTSSESISQTGVDENALHPSCIPEVLLHRLHSELERHIRSEGLDGHCDVCSKGIEIF